MQAQAPFVFPFKSVLTLRYLIEYWEKSFAAGAFPIVAHQIKEELAKAPELRAAVLTDEILAKHRPLVDFLMTAAIPPAQTNEELIAAMIPFNFKYFYATDLFRKKIDLAKIESTARVNIPNNSMAVGKTMHACLMILDRFYQVNVPFDKPILFTIADDRGLERIYKVEIGRQFLDIVATVKPEPIDPKIIRFLTEKVYDVDLWLQYIKPQNFEFHGFMSFRMVDVTEQEMISSIKYDLLEKNAVSKKDSFARIQHKLQSMFDMPDIKLGLAFFDHNNNIVLSSAEQECWETLAKDKQTGIPCSDYDGSIYEKSWIEKKFVSIENLEQYPFKTKVEEALLANGVKNLMLAPLVDEGQTIGLLELASPNPGKLNPMSAGKVESALPMFTAAVKRVREEMMTDVRAIIQEECTNIHPSVQWRFLEAGMNLLNRRRTDEKAVLEEIIFKDVHPLFGLADVRNSSIERNHAIQQDLLENLQMVKALLMELHRVDSLPILEGAIFKVDQQIDRIQDGLASGDESNVIEFLKAHIDPLVSHFKHNTAVNNIIEEYKSHLDPTHGVVYKRRKAFEQSLAAINRMISGYLDEAQEAAQQMFPHYFEKYQTDGVEYTLYVGQSMVKNKKFDHFHLKNFRLWQLLLMCEIDKRMEQLKPELANKLDITQLILVHDHALSVRFRPDEKQFDVDGAYDVRYEIVKKRIDKAYIKNSAERLTQPGKIAIVYNQTKMEEEFREYFDFLRAKKLITGEVEYVELEELPGASGLKAMRISIEKGSKGVSVDPLGISIKQALSLQ